MLLHGAKFPSTAQYKPAKWASIFIEPIAGSGERLLIAVAAISDGRAIVRPANFSKLRCLFGDASQSLEEICEIALAALQQDLDNRGEIALTEPQSMVSDVFISKPLEALARSAESLAEQWLNSLSSLAGRAEEREATAAIEANAEYVGESSGPLPKQVYDAVIQKDPRLSRYFRSDLQVSKGKAAPKKARSYDVSIDYTGAQLVTNFGSLISRKPTSLTRGLKQKLWDLDAYRGKRVHSGQFALADSRGHELLLLLPSSLPSYQPESYTTQINEMIAALEHQADPLEIRVRALPSVDVIAAHILSVESPSTNTLN